MINGNVKGCSGRFETNHSNLSDQAKEVKMFIGLFQRRLPFAEIAFGTAAKSSQFH